MADKFMTTREERRLVFGIYPGGAAGGDTGLLAGPPDDPKQVHACLNQLQGICRTFVVRCYDSFQDPGCNSVRHRGMLVDIWILFVLE
jgi:hypothetical protein